MAPPAPFKGVVKTPPLPKTIADTSVAELCAKMVGQPDLVVGIARCKVCGQVKYERLESDNRVICPKCGADAEADKSFPTIIVGRYKGIPEDRREDYAKLLRLKDGIPRVEALMRMIPLIDSLAGQTVSGKDLEAWVRKTCQHLKAEAAKIGKKWSKDGRFSI